MLDQNQDFIRLTARVLWFKDTVCVCGFPSALKSVNGSGCICRRCHPVDIRGRQTFTKHVDCSTWDMIQPSCPIWTGLCPLIEYEARGSVVTSLCNTQPPTPTDWHYADFMHTRRGWTLPQEGDRGSGVQSRKSRRWLTFTPPGNNFTGASVTTINISHSWSLLYDCCVRTAQLSLHHFGLLMYMKHLRTIFMRFIEFTCRTFQVLCTLKANKRG